MMKQSIIFFLLCLLLAPLRAQETLPALPRIENIAINRTDAVVIDRVVYILPGRTREASMRSSFGSLEQKGFSSGQELDLFIEDFYQTLDGSHLFRTVTITRSNEEYRNEQLLVEITIEIREGLGFIPTPYVLYSSSTGLDAGIGAIMGNTGGKLFDSQIMATINIPLRDNHFAWKDPTWAVVAQATNIIAGPVRLSVFFDFADQKGFIVDRGDELFGYRSMAIATSLFVNWPFSPSWELVTGVKGSYAFNNEILFHEGDFDYARPLRFSFSPSIGLWYDDAPWIGSARSGTAIKMNVAYILAAPSENYRLMHDVEINLKHGQFWRPTDFFFPHMVSQFYWKTGVPSFDLGRFSDGIIDSQWRGNGGLFVSSAFLFKIATWPGVLQLQLGPIVGYGAVFEPGRAFDVSDQGFTAGIQLATYIDMLPSIPVLMTLGFDLRQRHDNPTVAQRLEFSLNGSFTF